MLARSLHRSSLVTLRPSLSVLSVVHLSQTRHFSTRTSAAAHLRKLREEKLRDYEANAAYNRLYEEARCKEFDWQTPTARLLYILMFSGVVYWYFFQYRDPNSDYNQRKKQISRQFSDEFFRQREAHHYQSSAELAQQLIEQQQEAAKVLPEREFAEAHLMVQRDRNGLVQDVSYVRDRSVDYQERFDRLNRRQLTPSLYDPSRCVSADAEMYYYRAGELDIEQLAVDLQDDPKETRKKLRFDNKVLQLQQRVNEITSVLNKSDLQTSSATTVDKAFIERVRKELNITDKTTAEEAQSRAINYLATFGLSPDVDEGSVYQLESDEDGFSELSSKIEKQIRSSKQEFMEAVAIMGPQTLTKPQTSQTRKQQPKKQTTTTTETRFAASPVYTSLAVNSPSSDSTVVQTQRQKVVVKPFVFEVQKTQLQDETETTDQVAQQELFNIEKKLEQSVKQQEK